MDKLSRILPQLEQKGINANDISFSVLLALVSTVVSYRFAVGNQLEQLPIILRQLDPGYLTNDFFLSTTDDFGPRSYFVSFLGFICHYISLPLAYISLTFLCDLALVGVTLWAARSVIGTNRFGAAIAAVMTLGLASFHLGDATQIRYEIFQPASLAIPGALAAIVLGLQGRPISAASVALLTSLPHPLYGAEGGGIALGIAFFALLLPSSLKPGSGRLLYNLNWRQAFLKTLTGSVILGVGLAVIWWLPYQEVNAGMNLSTDEFYNILARFRAPHHYLPSHFRVNDYVSTIFFLLALAFAYECWVRKVPLRLAILILLPILVVLSACVVAYIFSEIWPMRAVLTLQLFRLLSIVKWLGFLLFGSVLSAYLLQPPNSISRPLSLLSLMSTGVTQSILVLVSLVMTRFQPWRWIGINPGLFMLLVGISALFLWLKFGSIIEAVYLIFAFGLVMAFVLRTAVTWMFVTAAIVFLIVVLAQNRESEVFAELVPVYDLSDQSDIMAETAWAVARVTPVDALLVAPPQFGLLRIIGGRALVVDFKSIPFQDGAMLKWRERMQNVYGEVENGGFEAVNSLDKTYKNITDDKLIDLAQIYGATHALLYIDSATKLPEIYVNDVYRLVKLPSKQDD